MKIALDPKVKVSSLATAIVKLRNQGYDVVSVPMIAEMHIMSEAMILHRMRQVHTEIRHAYPLISTHLVNKLYVADMPDMTRFSRCLIPPKSKTDIEAVKFAKACLAIGTKAYAIRFVVDRNDFLCRVWEDHFLSRAATGLFVHRVRSTVQAAENRHIPAREAANNIVGAVLAISPAINGSPQLPKEIKEIKAKTEDIFKGSWEKNFNKSRRGAWGLNSDL